MQHVITLKTIILLDDAVCQTAVAAFFEPPPSLGKWICLANAGVINKDRCEIKKA
jgi:hypothetical protein